MKSNWLGRHTLSDEHGKELEQKAAHHEFGGKLPRDEAEQKAYDDYKRNHHLEGAAHHLHGLRNAANLGERGDGAKHSAMLKMHLKALGFNPHDVPPPEVLEKMSDKPWTGFTNHPADEFVAHKG